MAPLLLFGLKLISESQFFFFFFRLIYFFNSAHFDVAFLLISSSAFFKFVSVLDFICDRLRF